MKRIKRELEKSDLIQHLREHEFKLKKGCTLRQLTENSLKEKERESEEKVGSTPQ